MFVVDARTESMVEFKQNVAFERGGGAYFEEAGFKTSVALAVFDSNVASFGGGLAFKDCQHVKLGESDSSVQIQRNTALNGGGVHIDLIGAAQVDYQVTKLLSLFQRQHLSFLIRFELQELCTTKH